MEFFLELFLRGEKKNDTAPHRSDNRRAFRTFREEIGGRQPEAGA